MGLKEWTLLNRVAEALATTGTQENGPAQESGAIGHVRLACVSGQVGYEASGAIDAVIGQQHAEVGLVGVAVAVNVAAGVLAVGGQQNA